MRKEPYCIVFRRGTVISSLGYARANTKVVFASSQKEALEKVESGRSGESWSKKFGRVAAVVQLEPMPLMH